MSPSPNYLLKTQAFHNRQYATLGTGFQRSFPSEDVVRFVKKYLDQSRELWLLDMGAALGNNTRALASLLPDARIVAADFCDYAVSLLGDLGLPHVFPTYCLFPDTAPISQFRFSAVIDHMCTYTLKQEDFASFLNSLSPQLEPGSLYYLKTLSKGSDLFIDVPDQDRDGPHSIQRVTRSTSPFPGDDYYFTFYTFEEVDSIFSKAGFQQLSRAKLIRTYRNTEEVYEQLELVYEKVPLV